MEGVFVKRFSCDMDRVLATDRFSGGLLDFLLTFFSESEWLLATPRCGSDFFVLVPCSDFAFVLSRDKARCPAGFGLVLCPDFGFFLSKDESRGLESPSECDRGVAFAWGFFGCRKEGPIF